MSLSTKLRDKIQSKEARLTSRKDGGGLRLAGQRSLSIPSFLEPKMQSGVMTTRPRGVDTLPGPIAIDRTKASIKSPVLGSPMITPKFGHLPEFLENMGTLIEMLGL